MNIHGQAQPSTPRTTKNNQGEPRAGHFFNNCQPPPREGTARMRRRGGNFYFWGAGDPHGIILFPGINQPGKTGGGNGIEPALLKR